MISASAEEYLEAIYKLGEEEHPVARSARAERLEITSVAANEMVRKLVERGLLLYEPYTGVLLTPRGQAQALMVIRRHRLWERFLTDILGLPWDQVHEEACRLEHATSQPVEERLEQFLEEPKTCPHGHPVPTAQGEVAVLAGCPLADLEAGQAGVVLRVPEEEAELLQYLESLGMEPQARIQVEAVAPFGGPLTVRVGGAQHPVSPDLASRIMVKRL
jgi:DtxR family Mn-dependent transcriptional regulator